MPPNNSQYDFILKGDQQPAPQQLQPDGSPKKFFLPKKAIFAGLGLVAVLVIGLVIFSSLNKTSGPTDQLVAVIGTAQEIARVSDLMSTASKDVGTLGLASTTSTVMVSESGDFAGYLSKASLKYDPKKLALYTDTKIDGQLTTAQQNNAVDETYYDYLKPKLEDYQRQLQALSGTSSKTLKAILESSYTSTQTLLAAPQLKS